MAERSAVVSWRRAHHGHLLRSVRETRPCRTNPSRRPWRYGRGRGCRTNSLLACIWPPKPGSGRIWAGRRFSPLKRPSAGQITLKRTFLRQNVIWPDQYQSIAETWAVREIRPCRTKSIAETMAVRETPALPNQFIAETVAVRETPGLPYRTFTPLDFHARAGSAQKSHVFLCRTCCIGVGLPVLLPRRAGFPRRSVRRGGILRDKLRETPVSLCATIKVLFLMLVLSAEE